ncbi:phosphate starvation-inducible protein PhoH [Candidatus Falkowbacteria bacterium RIFOXYB2_FULL_34_18]|uniref:Phosphate starvation-inducible protein PhoH n=1 Tax=Candidatus Falkowbacteria bacterium RIFOXYD2_FULL_34_120 TaxID=1798007 RepID=A0A1F5TS92_9BACT|nr:MAG: phosphate starvation-inducible protein PhoH [Candidatus Falkowbacteria bacterium RIFOXYB2_FULL_34_18]OGF29700.1 MAG: phosphate starvation-inducible protein PhoH [Candidatus Falkowbacteria bacterium RIFOXYC12_FULL_34_55]OGF37435.1 MAG: phosphate starvation-inducible protein PhoH [Candidatus Falkowbacteria bacterium RIFOXYC2_FULL_34_220]OGF39160.1 MAG: phosphate starvation-inducible protein PhoH [Candidatus Falkowbacteria bacterium RIFOXYD12_FULL_34_57]OGF41709.1 MAG: phosphate starvation
MAKTKIFVLDTNVILHDSACIYNFKDNEIAIPIAVIEELDRFKKGNDIINANARDFLRTFDALFEDGKLSDQGVPIDGGQGIIRTILEFPLDQKIKDNFQEINSDIRILNTVYCLSRKERKPVIFVTKDVNLRLKARSIGIKTENYQSKSVKDVSGLYTGIRTFDNVDFDIFSDLFQGSKPVNTQRLGADIKLYPNENVIIKSGSTSALACFDSQKDFLNPVKPDACYGIKPRNVEQKFALNAMLNRDVPLVTVTGKAGTGKTLLALAAALENKQHYRQIFLARPIVPLSNKDIGFLPGDVASKLDPYMQPLYDNLSVIQGQFNDKQAGSKQIKQLIEEEKIVITPISYIRGRSIVKVFFIVDEAQNLTPHEVKTIVTRAGEGTKFVFTGDIFQIDHPYLDSQTNGLSFLIEKMKGQKLYAHINLEKGERSELADLASKLL